MAYVVRGVQLFSGLTGPDEWGEGPLRRVQSLCGLLLGAQDALDLDDFSGQEADDLGQQSQRLRLATLDGDLVDSGHSAVDGHGLFQPFPAQKAHR
jgi:hypothetical protein